MKVLIKDIQPAFDNAHRPIQAKHSDNSVLSVREEDTLSAQWWKEEYNVKIHVGEWWEKEYMSKTRNVPWPTMRWKSARWKSAEFESESALTMFMLRWS
jgi:hypothetical protein